MTFSRNDANSMARYQPGRLKARNALGHLLMGMMAALLSLWSAVGGAQSLPRWEVGLGLGVLSLPYYRGAASGRTYITPIPYVQYRGEHLRIDREGIRGYLFRSERIKLDFSLAGGVPVPSDGNSARHGMPSLNPTVEIGPSLEALLWYSIERDRALWLKLPLRAAFSVGGGDIAQQGWVLAPYLDYGITKGNPTEPWNVNLSAGPQFADRAYHNYFYEVAPPYATPARPEYHPAPGYSGSRLTMSVEKQWKDYWLGAFARYDTLRGAAFSDSPVVQQKNYYAIGVAFIKLLAVSKKPEEIP